MLGCGSRQDDGNNGALPLPGNPKGEIYPDDFYDAAAPGPEAQMPVDAGVPDAEPTPPDPDPIPLPGNPKGALYVDDVYSDDD